MFEKLFSQIYYFQTPSQMLLDRLSSYLKKERLPKRTLLLKQGNVCDRMYYIEEGFARAFYYKGEQEVTSWFMQENEFIVSVNSFYTQQPAYESIELLEDSTLISITFSHLQLLYKEIPEFNFVGRRLTERYYCLSEERLMTMRMQSTREKYDTLLKSYPEIFQRAPLKYIASYLGMKPETLSRLRANTRPRRK